ncbi:NAD(P)-binding protein [Lophiostoma macrostomum CBS 122681]|uniref:3-dehydrosphinganine reductase n=1 Tax=Lophiostoma macrostomum CBS 122681 TaxID=1314788 RepID=A0A6A6TEZ8_9PLEO|nr:NAD(P)-binding protein [Lophiostoma macrostomum CBS 122681]
MGSILSKNHFPVEGRTVLITGGSKGLGLNAARQLAGKGANVMIAARGEEALKEAIASISKCARSADTQRFHAIKADVTTVIECARVFSECITWNNGSPPDIVWCCSGSAHPSLFVDTPLDQFQKMMDSNYFSCAYMSHVALNVWLHPSKKPETTPNPPPARHLIFTGSFVSFYSFTGFAPYSPSKAAVRALSDALSQEMNLYAAAHPYLPRIRVHTIFPATMPTQSLEDENRVKTDVTQSLEEGDQILSPEECARRAIKGLESGEELVPTSTIIRLVMASVMGGSIRGGFWKGLTNTILGWVTMVVMIFIRWEMDTKVAKWGKTHGSSGMKKKD